MIKNESMRLMVCMSVAVVVLFVSMSIRHREELQETSRAHADEVRRLERELADSKAKEKVTVLETSTVTVAKEVPPVTTTVLDGKQILSMSHTPQVLGMKPCKAKLVSMNPCTGSFDIGDGQELHLGGPFTSRPIYSFLRTLEKGETYEMPGAFIEFLDKGNWKKHPADTMEKVERVADEKF